LYHPIVAQDTLTILVVDDEPQIRRLVRNALVANAGLATQAPADAGGPAEIRVVQAATGQEGIDMAAAEQPALIVLDLGLPDMDGLEVCREVRRWSAAPIIVLSARHSDTEKAALLDAGADDYVTKPFSSVELMARVRAQMRRARASAGAPGATNVVVSFGNIVVDQQRRRLERAGMAVHLTRTEWALLRTLLAHPRQTLTHQQIFREVWGNVSGDAQQYLRVYVGHLRRKIEEDAVRPRFIHTEPGVGYRFEPDGVPE
jgi:two-component system KDP operon response regulator KdpE